jgi:hypothetical protein
MSYEAWLRGRNMDASRKIVATGILVFDFELLIGERLHEARVAVFPVFTMIYLLS